MKNFLPGLLLLPLLACASFQETEEEPQTELISSGESPSFQKTFSHGRVDQEVFNNDKASGKVNDLMILRQIYNFLPEMHALLSKTSKEGREVMANNPFFLEDLASRLGIDRLKQLPVHSDLKIFENFEFPKTPMGKAEAVALVYKIAKHILNRSSIYSRLMEIFYDELLDFSSASQESFERFSVVLNLEREFDGEIPFFLYAIRNGRIDDLIKLSRFIPLSQWASYLFSFDEGFTATKLLIAHFTKKPEHVEVFCGSFTFLPVFCLLASELPVELVKQFLQRSLISTRLDTILCLLPKILASSLEALTIDYEYIDHRISEVIDH